MLKTEQYYGLDQDIIDYFKDLEKNFSFALDIKYLFQANTKQKQLITVKKIPDNYAVILEAELLVTVNEEYFNVMDDNIRKILFEQEIDKIIPNLEKGTLKIVQPSLKTSAGIVKKFTYESVERANETQRLLAENKLEE
jgi:pyruvate/2-oxoglutarate/acetoin dehydrogenase E1 component